MSNSSETNCNPSKGCILAGERDESGVICSKDGKRLLKCNNDEITGHYNISDGVEVICDYAFADCRSLESVTIPGSVTSIGDYAFSGCESLKSVNIPESVSEIFDSAFDDCGSLQDIKVSAKNRWFLSEDDVLFDISKSRLIRCSSRYKEYVIPDSVSEIGAFAFTYCELLKSVLIPESVKKIGDNAFDCCDSLESVTMLGSDTEFSELTFWECKSLKSITVPKGSQDKFKSMLPEKGGRKIRVNIA